MKKIIILTMVFTVLAACAVYGVGQSVAVGNMELSGRTVDMNPDGTITVKGNARFVASSTEPLPAGQMRLDSLGAQSITIELTKSKDKKFTPKSAVADGGVTIEAQRSNVTKDQAGQTTTTLQNVHAVAQTATMDNIHGNIVLSGKVSVKITEPGVADPVYSTNCDRLTFSLKENKMRAESDSGDLVKMKMSILRRR